MNSLQQEGNKIIHTPRRGRSELYLRVKTRTVRLPWFRCKHCGQRLAQVEVVNGRTCVRIGARAISYHVCLTCKACGAEREFVGMTVNY